MRFTSEEKKNFFLPSHHDEKKNQGEREMNLMNMIKLLLSFECCTSTRFFLFWASNTPLDSQEASPLLDLFDAINCDE
jgi:hypothetical protein